MLTVDSSANSFYFPLEKDLFSKSFYFILEIKD